MDTYSPVGFKVGTDGKIVVPEVEVTRGNFTVIAGNFDAVPFASAPVNNDGMWSAADPAKIFVRTPGTYGIVIYWNWIGIPAGTRVTGRLNAMPAGVIISGESKIAPTNDVASHLAGFYKFKAGDYAEFRIGHDNAANQTMSPPTLRMILLSQ